VSYIVTFCPSIYEAMDKYLRQSRKDGDDTKYARVGELMKNDLLKTGTKMYLEDTILYVKRYKFDDDETTYDEILNTSEEEIDFETIQENDLWDYIYGQFLMKGDLGKISGFGVTWVETY
jgi:hypothetical protein